MSLKNKVSCLLSEAGLGWAQRRRLPVFLLRRTHSLIRHWNLFIWLHSVFAATCRLSLVPVPVNGGYSSLKNAGSSSRWLLLCVERTLHAWTSAVAAHRLSSCGIQAQLLRGVWNPLEPGIKPMSLALAGRFLSTVPPRKSWNFLKNTEVYSSASQTFLMPIRITQGCC